MDLATNRHGETPGVNITFLEMEGDHVRQLWMCSRRSPKDILDLWCEHTEPSPGTTLSTRSAQTQVQKGKAAVIPLDEETPGTAQEHMLDRLLRLENDFAKLTDSDSIDTLAERYRRLENIISAMELQKKKLDRLEDLVDFLLIRSKTQCWTNFLEPFAFQ